jgi:hypothetical protein
MSSLRTAMARAEEPSAEERASWQVEEAMGQALVNIAEDDYEKARREREELERQAREDEYASWAMEIIVRARQRVGRTKWSATEGAVKRRIVEALRCLPSDD